MKDNQKNPKTPKNKKTKLLVSEFDDGCRARPHAVGGEDGHLLQQAIEHGALARASVATIVRWLICG